jgi:hypothetical protein
LEHDARAHAFTSDFNQACRLQLFNVMGESCGTHAVALAQSRAGHRFSKRGDLPEHLNAPRFGQNPTDSGNLTVRQSINLRSYIFVRVRHELRSLRDYSEFPKLRELPSETLMRVDAICETGLANLDCA